jgi:hypothetical protein
MSLTGIAGGRSIVGVGAEKGAEPFNCSLGLRGMHY